MNISSKGIRHLRKYLIYSSIFFIVALLFVFFGKQMSSILLILFLIVLGCLCKMYKRFTGSISFGFELITPITILFACKVGVIFAICASIFMFIMAEFISGHFVAHSIIFQIAGLIGISVLAGLMSVAGVPFLIIAYILIVARNIYLFMTMVFIGGVDIFRAFLSSFPNIIINIFIISKIGLFLVNALS